MYILHHSVWHQALCRTASEKHFSVFSLTNPFLSSAPFPLFCTVYIGVSSWMPTRSDRQAEALHIPPLPSPSHTSISSQQRPHYIWASYRSENTIHSISQRWDWILQTGKRPLSFLLLLNHLKTKSLWSLHPSCEVQWGWGKCMSLGLMLSLTYWSACCLPFSLQVQKGILPKRPSSDLTHLHLCEWGAFCHPSLCPLSRQSHTGPPPQGDHSGGWQQRWRLVEARRHCVKMQYGFANFEAAVTCK